MENKDSKLLFSSFVGIPHDPIRHTDTQGNDRRYLNCCIGKEGVEEKHLLSFNEFTGRYYCCAFAGGNTLTADEIDALFYVYDIDGKLLND